MRIFNINFYKLTTMLLPTFLRKPVVMAFLNTAVSPIITLYTTFASYRESNIYRLSITPQVCYLQKMLNDRFDNPQRRITINDTTIYPSTYIYQEDELRPLYIYQQAESNPVYLFRSAETYPGAADFTVTVPWGLSFDENEMRALLGIYKLPTTKYIISYE